MPTNKKLDVFISSDIGEFKRLRRDLASKIRTDLLESTPLEKRGADIDDAIEASLKGVRESGIYVGIFGRKYSETTIKEYHEAIKKRKPVLTYVKDIKERDLRLSKFVKEELSPQFKYHKFRTNKELEKQVRKDLNSTLLRILGRGLQSIQRSKKQALNLEKKARHVQPQSQYQPRYIALMNQATFAFAKGEYQQSVIMSSMAVEVALRDSVKHDQDIRPKIPLGSLLSSLERRGALSSNEVAELREVTHLRNSVLHEGEVPSRESAEYVLRSAEHFVKRRLDQSPRSFSRGL